MTPLRLLRVAPTLLAPLLAPLLTAACAYDPPVRADHDAPRYHADLAACRETADAAADRAVKARFYLFASYPISFPLEKRAQIRTCMTAKGYSAPD